MYNRYVPQSDGSFQKQKLQEPQSCHSASSSVDSEIASPTVSCEPLEGIPDEPREEHCAPHQTPENHSIGHFLKSLFPQGLDVEDLMVILLLLLISGDKGKDGNNALFTLGAYLFLC